MSRQLGIDTTTDLTGYRDGKWPPRVAVLAGRTIRGVPGVDLAARPAASPLGPFELAQLLDAADRLSFDRPLEHLLGRARHRVRDQEVRTRFKPAVIAS